MKLKDLLKEIDGKKLSSLSNFDVQGIAYDSRKVKPNFVFVALKGTQLDGHQYVEDAIMRGAKAIVVNKKRPVLPSDVTEVVVKDTRSVLHKLSTSFYGAPSEKLKIVGITGTHGKTTTSFIIRAILESCGYGCGLIGTINYQIGERVITSFNTTPESLDLQTFFKEMKDEGNIWCSMEVSSHAIEQQRIEGVLFDAGVFMNISRHEHLDYHKTFKAYLMTKVKFFSHYLAESSKANKTGVVNADDKYSAYFIKALAKEDIGCVTFGKKKTADIRLKDYAMTKAGSRIDLIMDGSEVSLNTKIKGIGNVYNILAAIAFAKSRQLNFDKVKQAVEELVSVPGRYELVEKGQPFEVIVDFAHTHYALKNLLASVRETRPRRIILVFGCGGDRDKSKRGLMGSIAIKMADVVFITSDNPRTEDPKLIIRDIERGVPFYLKKKYVSFVDRAQAIAEAVSIAREGDCVIIAGKGHETFQLFKNTTIPFDDRDEARKAIQLSARRKE